MRTEEDSLGPVEVPDDAYYGAFTQRAADNFRLTGDTPPRAFIRAFGQVKLAAARANQAVHDLSADNADAIQEAAQEVIDGAFDDQFVIDVLQAGAGTPIHMNANEVIANRATELLGDDLGDYTVHPNDHVNMGQSSNNVVPTATRLATLQLTDDLLDELAALADAFEEKADAFSDIIKVGRTHLQDAVPIRLGQEFAAYATHCRNAHGRIDRARQELLTVGLGGNAIGTGINTDPAFRETVVDELAEVTGRDLAPADDPVAITQSMAPFASVSGTIRAATSDLVTMADDLMLLSSGPVAGIGEITLPPVEEGSSIMPGKVNPSTVEAFKMSCLQVKGNDAAIAAAADEGDLDMHVMTPLIAQQLFDAVTVLTNACRMLREDCITGIEADEDRIQELFDGSTATATALSPYLGYDLTADVVHAALDADRSVRDEVLDRGLLTADELEQVLDPERMTGPHGVDQALVERVQDRVNDR